MGTTGGDHVVVSADAAATAQNVLGRVHTVNTLLSQAATTAGTLSNPQFWDSAGAERFRARAGMLLTNARTAGRTLETTATTALASIQGIDRADAANQVLGADTTAGLPVPAAGFAGLPPIPNPQGGNVVATPVSQWWDFLNPVNDVVREIDWELSAPSGFTIKNGYVLSDQVAWYMREIAGSAQGAGVDPRLLMDFLINDEWAHLRVGEMGIPHSALVEAIRSIAARYAEFRGRPGGSLGMANVGEDAWKTAIATQLRDTGHSDLATHDWRDMVDDPTLSIEAASWVLRNVQDNLGTVNDTHGYTRNQLLAIGYNKGVGVMRWMAEHGTTPGQSPDGTYGATAQQIQEATWYYQHADNQWNDTNSAFCQSGVFSCSAM